MKVLCVLNPSAAGGAAEQLWPEIAEMLRRQDVEFDLLRWEASQSLKDQVAAHLAVSGPANYDVVAGVGGDGTHAGIINGLMEYATALPMLKIPLYAFLPLGTGNDIAKSLGIRLRDEFSSRDLRRAVSTIVHGANYRMDLGFINGTYFADALTVGLDSRILKERNANKKKIEKISGLKYLARGRFLYTLSLGKPFFQHAPVDVQVLVDDQEWYKGPMINLVINNTRIYAGDFDFSADAYPDDGLLDLVLFTDHADYLARYLLSIRHHPDKIREYSDELHRRSMHVQGHKIELKLEKPEASQLDGEEFHEDQHFKVTVAPRALAIKTPAEPM